jgi:hypothetical protein
MATKVEIIYEAEATSLKATVNEVNKANDAVVASAQESSKKVADSYKTAGKSIAAAFSGNEVKKALADQNKAFDDLNKKGVPLTRVLRGLKNELNALEEAGKGGTAQFRQLEREAARLEDQIGDTRARVANLASDTFKFDAAVQATQGLAAGFEVAQGAAALFGSESEDLQKALLKVQAATAIANGVQQIANLLLEESKIKTLALAAAQRVYAFVTTASATATKVWRAALVSTGIGAIVVLLGSLISSFLDTAEATEEAAEKAKEYQKAIDELNKTSIEGQTKAGNAQIQLLQKQGRLTDEAAKRLISFNNLQTGLSNAATAAKEKETEALKRFEERKAEDIKAFGKVTKTTQEQLSKDLIKIEQTRANEERELRANQQIELINIAEEAKEKQKAAEEKRIEEAKKRAEAEKKAAEEAEKERQELLKKRIATDKRVGEEIAASRAFDLQEELAAVAVAEDASFELKIQSLEKQKAIEIEAAESTGQLTADIAKKYDELIAEQRSQQIQAQLNTELNALRTLEVEQGSTLDRRIEIINLEAEARRKAAKDSIKDEKERASAIELINAQTEQAIRDERKKSADEAIDQAFEIAQASVGALESILKFQSQLTENRIAEIQSTSEKELEAINSSLESEVVKANKREALEKRTQSKIAAEKLKQAKQEKALNIFKATIDTAASIVKTGAQLGYPAALPFQILAGIVGAANIAAIAAQPLPKFKKGGMVGGRSHEAGGTLIEAERGEFVVNKASVAQHRKALDAMNTSSAAFRKFIDDKYVRPAIAGYALNMKDRKIEVNAQLNSRSMEREIKGLRRDMRNKNTIVNINGGDSRYTWQ